MWTSVRTKGQQAVADVVTSVLDRDNSWEALVAGGVTALGVPERLGGDGVGLSELATALTEIGRHGTTGPALAILGATAVLLDLASEAQQDRYLAGVAKGSIADAGPQRTGCCTAGQAGGDARRRQAQRHEDRRSLCRTGGLDRRDRRHAVWWWSRRRPTVCRRPRRRRPTTPTSTWSPSRTSPSRTTTCWPARRRSG